MYYLLVYAQLVALTPLLFRAPESHRGLLYAVSPPSVALWELAALYGIDLPNLGRLFPMWLLFYLAGVEWARWRSLLRGRVAAVAAVAALALAAQVAEGFLWDACGDYNMATTQLRLTNTVSSLAVMALFMLAADAVRERLVSCRLLVHLGDLSFGVYLCHVAMLMVFRRLFEFAGITGFLSSLVFWLVILAASAIFVAFCQRILPRRIAVVMGFV